MLDSALKIVSLYIAHTALLGSHICHCTMFSLEGYDGISEQRNNHSKKFKKILSFNIYPLGINNNCSKIHLVPANVSCFVNYQILFN